MKKSILAILLALALVSPMFAATAQKKAAKPQTKQTAVKKETKPQYQKGRTEIVGKLGFSVNPVTNYCSSYWSADSYDRNPALSIAVEGLYSVLPELPIGLGVNYQFDSKEKGLKDYEEGATNIYLTAKPTAKIDSKIFTGIYAIAQIGYGLNRISGKGWNDSEIDSNGLYWGLGAGTEIMNDFIFEFIFSTNYWSYKIKRYSTKYDVTSTALTLFAGYKFNL